LQTVLVGTLFEKLDVAFCDVERRDVAKPLKPKGAGGRKHGPAVHVSA